MDARSASTTRQAQASEVAHGLAGLTFALSIESRSDAATNSNSTKRSWGCELSRDEGVASDTTCWTLQQQQRGQIRNAALVTEEKCLSTSSSTHIITDRMEEGFSPDHKRMRLTEQSELFATTELSSPEPLRRIVTHVSTNVPHSVGRKYEQRPVEWWKQKRPQIKLKGNQEAEPLCHVCQQPYDASEKQQRSSPQCPPSRTKTLLSYFTPKQPLNTTSTQRRSSLDATCHQKPQGCTFCERTNICTNCLQTCQDCLLPFCSFCRTTDYRHGPARGVCLDCAKAASLNTNVACSEEDDTAMQLD